MINNQYGNNFVSIFLEISGDLFSGISTTKLFKKFK